MSNKQARLIAAISDAMAAQNISQNTLARKSGVSQSMISSAILGKYDPKEEKWRMICETLGLDYDAVIEDVEETVQTKEDKPQEDAHVEEMRGGTAVPLSEEEEDLVLNEDERRLMDITSRYLAGHLKEDVRKGMDISLEDLHTLLTVCKRMQAAAKATDE